MTDIKTIAPAFVEMAHAIVWASVATVDSEGRPRSRILHPIWQWDGESLTGWVGTAPTKTKRAHLSASPYVSVNYWSPNQDTCVAECRAEFIDDPATREWLWDQFKSAPAPLGFDPALIPIWSGPDSPHYFALRMVPWRLRVFPGTFLMGGGGEVLTWEA